MMIKYSKYHGLGNDYIVIEPIEDRVDLTSEDIRLICHRNYGVGSDGILYGPLPAADGQFGLRIFNPDGSEAEKSGNGLRIFARYLWDNMLVQDDPFTIATPGGVVQAQVLEHGKQVSVEMGRVSFDSEVIPVQGPPREVINEQMVVDGVELRYCAATVGNPHCVVLNAEVTPDTAKRLGPRIETDPKFSNRTNVQFLKVLDRNNIQIEIWERGAGYTLASGSSSSAAAAVAHRLGLCDNEINVHMPGGIISIQIAPDFSITMSGPVVKVCNGAISDEMFSVSLPAL